ncbi:hypothetical protein QYF36_000357 [Acer negundo]|nr:hypothetical protein QYF36_000357 [Acer negundo]
MEEKVEEVRSGCLLFLVGSYKVNTDAALDANEGRIGVGIIIRNCVGDVMASSSQVVKGGFTVLVVETLATLRGLRFACDTDLLSSSIESDARVVNIINSGSRLFLRLVWLLQTFRGVKMVLQISILLLLPVIRIWKLSYITPQ